MITTIKLINMSTISHSYLVYVSMWEEHLRSILLDNFKHLYSVIIITMLYIRSSEIIHLITESV